MGLQKTLKAIILDPRDKTGLAEMIRPLQTVRAFTDHQQKIESWRPSLPKCFRPELRIYCLQYIRMIRRASTTFRIETA